MVLKIPLAIVGELMADEVVVVVGIVLVPAVRLVTESVLVFLPNPLFAFPSIY